MSNAMKAHIPRTFVAAACAAGILAGATAAFAAPPAQCADPHDTRLYNLGVLKGRSLVNEAWNAPSIAHDCDKIDALKQLVVTVFNVAPPPGTPPLGGVCQGLGMRDGAVARINEIGTACNAACAADGSFIGELAAELYCQLSEALGGLGLDITLLDGALNSCGTHFEGACFTHFDSQVLVDTSCTPFTIAPFTAVYNQARSNQCIYNPQP
jgi:hypothetical protein